MNTNQGGESVTISAKDVGALEGALGLAKKQDWHARHRSGRIQHSETVDKSIFCAACQAHTTHKLSRTTDPNGHDEMLATCDCGAFMKFPMTEDPAQLAEWVDNAHKHNVGQITVEVAAAQEEEKDARFKKLMGIA